MIFIVGVDMRIGGDFMSQKYSDDDLISAFWRFFEVNKRYPLQKDFKHNPEYPNATVFYRRFGSWFNFLDTLGVLGDKEWYKCDEQVLIELYENGNKDEIMNRLMVKRKWEAIMMKANSMGLKVKKEIKYKCKYDSEEVRKQILEDVISFYRINGITPHKYELNFPKNAIDFHWESYNDLLLECDLPILRRQIEIDTKEEGISFLINLKNHLNRNPTVNDVNEYGIHKNWFKKKFGGFKKALLESGLIDEIESMSTKRRVEKSIQGLQQLHFDIKRPPTVDEYTEFARKNKLCSYGLLQTHYKKPFSEISMMFLGEKTQVDRNKDDLFNQLFELKNKLGRPPMAKELKEYGLEPYNVYISAFGMKFNEIIKSFGWQPSGHVAFFKTDDELLQDYYNLYMKIERMPFQEDINKCGDMAHYTTYKNRFGSIFDICILLNIDWKKYIQNKLSGKDSYYYLDRNNEICRSHQEMVITNLLIENQIKYVKEVFYKDYISGDDTKRTFDWYLPNENVFVEYFGLFRKKDILAQGDNYTKKTLKKIETCEHNELALISLFPQEVRRTYKHVIDKFAKFGITINVEETKEFIA